MCIRDSTRRAALVSSSRPSSPLSQADVCGSRLTPVSYTHLDVYKRQLFARGATRAPDAGPGETMLVDPSGNEFLVQVADLVVRADDE